MDLIQYYQITFQPVNQPICVFIIMTIVFYNRVSIKSSIVLLPFILALPESMCCPNDITNMDMMSQNICIIDNLN